PSMDILPILTSGWIGDLLVELRQVPPTIRAVNLRAIGRMFLFSGSQRDAVLRRLVRFRPSYLRPMDKPSFFFMVVFRAARERTFLRRAKDDTVVGLTIRPGRVEIPSSRHLR